MHINLTFFITWFILKSLKPKNLKLNHSWCSKKLIAVDMFTFSDEHHACTLHGVVLLDNKHLKYDD
jgi:hypothetical protein